MSDRIKDFRVTSVYEAVLKHDMIQTIEETGLPYCDAFIKDTFQDNDEYPLTWVYNSIFLCYPLRKDDVIYVEFRNRDVRVPVLVGIKSCALLGGEEIPKVWKDFKAPSGGGDVKPPSYSKDKLFSFDVKSKDIYTLYHDDTVIQVIKDTVFYKTVDCVYVFTKEKLQAYAKEVTVEAGSKLKALVGSNTNIEMSSSGIKMKGQMIELN